MSPAPRLVFALLAAVVIATGAPPADSSGARERIAGLRAEIARHDELYHRRGTPEIGDAEYDRLKRELAELERAFPAAAAALPARSDIGDDRSGQFETRRHRERMLSLEKAHTPSELRAFHARVLRALGHRADVAFVVEPKIDGLAVSLTYERGRLARALTRGDGSEGDDITANVRQIATLPDALQRSAAHPWPEVIELRGEIYVPWSEFARVNDERETAGEPRFANPRNLAAGTIRQLDAHEVARRGLCVRVFAVGAREPATSPPASQRDLSAILRAWGVPGMPEARMASTAGEVWQAVEAVRVARPGYEFPIDGAVVKVDSFADQRRLGAGESAPHWAIAYKFEPERAETEVRAITLQVGRTGVLTPVAELAPVRLGGATIARATLHNRDEVVRKDIRVGDFVYVEKAGEIIPAVVGVNLERRPPAAQPYALPGACPDCGGPILGQNTEALVRCGNGECPGQLRRRIEHFASKAGVEIEGLGPAMIDALVEKGWVRQLPDVYRLRRDDLLSLGKNNAKSVDRLLAAIEASKRAELWRIIHGLSLPQVGVATAKDLARQCGSLRGLLELGPNAATVLAEPRYRTLIRELLNVGVGAEPVGPAPVFPAPGKRLAGKVVALTGTLPTLTRAEAIAKIEAAGGRVSDSVRRGTDYLVVGASPGAKLDQARTQGVRAIDEAELLRLLEERLDRAKPPD